MHRLPIPVSYYSDEAWCLLSPGVGMLYRKRSGIYGRKLTPSSVSTSRRPCWRSLAGSRPPSRLRTAAVTARPPPPPPPPVVTLTPQRAEGGDQPGSTAGRPPPPLLPYTSPQNGHGHFYLPGLATADPTGLGEMSVGGGEIEGRLEREGRKETGL